MATRASGPRYVHLTISVTSANIFQTTLKEEADGDYDMAEEDPYPPFPTSLPEDDPSSHGLPSRDLQSLGATYLRLLPNPSPWTTQLTIDSAEPASL
jgi:hypothetical protein